ncbi:spore germination protein [Clostridium sp.]|uniref:spore germination protein n=1 Tax=Clostridium sp. TaxID=1506 RepID=UPI0034640857
MEKNILTEDLLDNVNEITSRFQGNPSLIKKELILNENIKVFIIYLDQIADGKYIEESIIHPLLFFIKYPLKKDEELIRNIMSRYLVSSNCETSDDISVLCSNILKGKTVILIEDSTQAILCNTVSSNYRSIQESITEKSVKAARESFVENIEINLAMIERKISNNKFKVEKYVVGEITNTSVFITYIDGLVEDSILNNVKNKVNAIKSPSMLSIGFIEQLMEDHSLNIFPTAKSTERPDKVAADLLEGKVAILVAENSSALIVPATFVEFLEGFDDYSQRTIVASFSRILRFIALFLILFLDSIYLVVLAYNSILFPYKLVILLIDSRLNIPLPPFLEILCMELAVETLREGGLRLPSPIGSTLAIVGGLVIGEAATRANLASYSTLLVVAITVICSFLIPNYEMVLSIRILRFFLLILAQIFGFFGIIVGGYLLLIILIKTESFGVPYFSPLAPLRSADLKDSFIRSPLKYILRKPDTYKESRWGDKDEEDK